MSKSAALTAIPSASTRHASFTTGKNIISIMSLSDIFRSLLKVKMNRGLSVPLLYEFSIYCTNLKNLNSISIFTNGSPFNSVCFLLPMLCQITMNVEGCKTLVSSRGLAAVVKCLVNLIDQHGGWIDNDGSIFLACDTILNVLLKKELGGLLCGESSFIHLLEAIANSTEDSRELSVIMMGGSICALIFDFTSENALLSNPNFADKSLDKLCRLFSRIFILSQQKSMNDDEMAQMDLLEIITAGYSRWGDRFPRVQKAISRLR